MKKTILVVEDFTTIRNFICESLQRKGYDTLAAANGKEAWLRLTSTRRIDLVLTDTSLPDCTGLELLERIKSNKLLADIPVFFVTTEGGTEKIEAAKKAGLSAWIQKPYRAKTFFDQVDNALNQG